MTAHDLATNGLLAKQGRASLVMAVCRKSIKNVALVATAMSLGIGCAQADVFEIDEGGTVIVRAGAEVGPAGARADVASAAVEASEPEFGPDVPAPALTTVGAPTSPASFQAAVLAAARRYDVSPELLSAVVWQESRWQPTALSAKGAIGLAQLMPATARALAVDPHDSGSNLAGAAHYLRQLLDLFDGDVERALAAYNAGPARVLRAGGVPAIAETRDYVSRIMARLALIRPVTLTGTGATP